jgi:Flp pilus assembly pilin Flp
MRRGPQRLDSESGQTLVEYALIIAIVALGSILALGFMSGKVNSLFSKAGNSLNTVQVAEGSSGGTGGTGGTGGSGSGSSGSGGGSAPATPSITSGPAEGSSGSSAAFTSPSFAFTSDGTETGFECKLDGGAFSACTSPRSYGPLGSGAHSFQVQAVNGSGTSSPATRNWTVGAPPATPTITAGPAEGSSGSTAAFTSPSFSFTGDGTQTGFQCSLDLAAFTTCTSPQAYSGLGSGAHSFRVQASNGNGTSAPATRNWTVSVAAPSGGSITALQAFNTVGDIPGSPDGSPDDGDILRAVTGGWSGSPTSYTWTWEVSTGSCSSSSWSAHDTNTGTTTSDTTVAPDQSGGGNGGDRSYRVRVTATNAGGTSSATAAVCIFVENQ